VFKCCVVGGLKDNENNKTPVSLFKRPLGCAGNIAQKLIIVTQFIKQLDAHVAFSIIEFLVYV